MASSAPTQAAGPLAPGVRAGATAWAGPPTASARSVRRSRWWFELLIIAWLAWLYDIVTNLAPLRIHVAIGHAWGIWHAEQALHLDPELTLNRWLAAHHTLAIIASYYYDNAHFIVTFGLLGYLWWRRPDIYRPLRNSLALVNVIGFAVFWLYPLAPPRMLVSLGFTDVVANSGTFGSWHTGALASSADQLAAMPSLHIAWACWCALAVWRMTSRPALRVLAVLYPCLTAVIVCATGNHFLFDVLGGAAAMALSVWLVEIAPRLLRGVGRAAALR
jgi:diacylglycerol O-acyltransferase / wax synthase